MITKRIFSANVGEPSTGNSGPDAIEIDIDNLLANDQELQKKIDDLDVNKVNKAQGDWITATLQNGWTGTLKYRKNQIGYLEISGVMTAGTLAWGTVMAIIPTTYFAVRNFTPITLFSLDGNVLNGLAIASDGSIKIYNELAGKTIGQCLVNDIIIVGI